MTSSTQIKRFERWQRTLPKQAAFLVSATLSAIVPLAEQRGYSRHPDYAGGDRDAVGANCLPLQRREGREWPTIEIRFDRRGRPSMAVIFARIPEFFAASPASEPV